MPGASVLESLAELPLGSPMSATRHWRPPWSSSDLSERRDAHVVKEVTEDSGGGMTRRFLWNPRLIDLGRLLGMSK
jgi:hypothetical protein